MSNSVDKLPAHETKHQQQSSEQQDPESNISVTSKPEDSAPTPATAAFDPHTFPEGGTQAWMTVAGAAAFVFVSFGWVNSICIFQEYYQDSLLKDYTPSQIAWIPSLMLLFMFIGGILVGKVFDESGAAYLLAFGSSLHVIGTILTSVSTRYIQILLCQGVVSALGCCMLLFPAVACVSTWFRAKRGAALGLVMGASSLGGVIFPAIVTQLIPQVGFGWTLRICALLILLLTVFGNFTVKSRFPPSRKPFDYLAYVRPFREPTFLFLSLGIFFFWWGMFIPINFIVSNAIQRHVRVRLARYLVPIMNATGIIGRSVPNALADKLGHYNVMITFASLTSVLVLGVLMPTNDEGALIAFATLFGISSGAVIGLAPVLCAVASPIQEIGSRTGAAYFLASFAALTGNPIGGQLIVIGHGSFFRTFLFAGVCCAVGTVSLIISRITHVGLNFKKV